MRYGQGRLLGRMEGLAFELQREVALTTLTKDAVKSSAIEGKTYRLQRCARLLPAGLVLILLGLSQLVVMLKA